MITARLDESTAVKCFELGADDFVRKPFGLEELKSRISRVIQLNKQMSKQVNKQTGDLKLDSKSRRLLVAGKEIPLTRSEFIILQSLMSAPGGKISREELAEKLALPTEGSDRTLDVHISRIRTKAKQVGGFLLSIESVYGEGYVLETHQGDDPH
jgi:DNA-binding response OmpR family regulator